MIRPIARSVAALALVLLALLGAPERTLAQSTLDVFGPKEAQYSGADRPSLGVRNRIPYLGFPDDIDGAAYFTSAMHEAFAAEDLSVVVTFFAVGTTGNAKFEAAFERHDNATDADSDSFDTAGTATVAVAGTSGVAAVATITFAASSDYDGIGPGEQYRLRLRVLGDDVAHTTAGLVQVTSVRVIQAASFGGGASLTATDNEGAASLQTENLPAAVAGGVARAYAVVDADGLKLVANGSDLIRLGDEAQPASAVQSTSVGSTLLLFPVTGGWVSGGLQGSWTTTGLAITQDLLASWTFDGDTLTDTSGNAHDLSMIGTVPFADGKIGRCVSFNATGANRLEMTAGDVEAFDFGASDFTISCWINPNAVGTVETIYRIMCGKITANYFYLENRLAYFGGVAANHFKGTTGAVSTGTWQHVVVRRNGTAWRLFLNGSQDGAGATTSTSVTNTASPWTITYNADSAAFNGLIDEVHVWTRALTDDEISFLYGGGAGAQFSETVTGRQ